MTKNELLDELQEFNTHHSSRLRSIENSLKGIMGDLNTISCVKIADCLLYKWLVKREKILLKVFSRTMIDELKTYHEDWHEESQKICILSTEYNKKNSGVFNLVFGKKDIKITDGNKDMALLYLSNLKELTVKIDKIFKKMVKRVNAMPSDMFRLEK